jgi:quercetin dioxygenase-like cupin family protein
VEALRLQGLGATPSGFCSVGVSYYLSGGRAEMSAGPTEKIYIVIDGELTVELADGERSVLRPLDSCLIAPREAREVRNDTNAPATLLVVMPLSPPA